MKTKYFTMLAAGLLLAASTDGCSMAGKLEDEMGKAIGEPNVYKCAGDESAGMVPHKPNEMHCCMTEVEEHVHDETYSLTGDANEELEIGAEVPNYVQAELKAAGKLTFGAEATLVKSYQAKHKAEAHCATHTHESEGQCKPTYVRSRYDFEGSMAVHSEQKVNIGTMMLGLFEALLPVKFKLDGDGRKLLIQDTMSLCVEADHTDSECSPPVGCQNGQGPGCALTDAGVDGAACALDGSGCTGNDAAVDPCDGLVGAACFACCETSGSYGSCVTANQCKQ